MVSFVSGGAIAGRAAFKKLTRLAVVGFLALPLHGERHGLRLNLIRRADFRQARIILLEQVEKFGLAFARFSGG